MDNTNSAIGELFHKTEVKDPVCTTQRRNEINKTEMRYVENLLITKANKNSIWLMKMSNILKRSTNGFCFKS